MTCILVWFIIVSIYYDLILDEKSPELEKKRIEWVTNVWQICKAWRAGFGRILKL